jgi:serine/threonine-protein kinase ULK2
MAPEILKGDQYDERADLWSIGIMLFQMVCGRVPFPASNQKDLYEKVIKAEFRFPEDVNVSDLCLDMITHLIRVQPEKRIHFKTAKMTLQNHPFSSSDPKEYSK